MIGGEICDSGKVGQRDIFAGVRVQILTDTIDRGLSAIRFSWRRLYFALARNQILNRRTKQRGFFQTSPGLLERPAEV
ncbi:hypothetical protein CCAX7_12670 [Capsulimonas corticalis]|uniref:Uncharacterized protein n=1 Tax=Capsulimonas corticalis TaxID=2219043 RepID=A0A402D4D0_9BACT|nr:hypothetical protein CCAX7_12670 [Capsulimonas corticalis]